MSLPVIQPLPRTSASLSWKPGTGKMTVRSDGATRLTMAHLRRGTLASVDGRRRAVAGRSGRVTVTLGAGTSVVKLAGSQPRGRE